MTRQIPEGNTLRGFESALAPLRAIAADRAGLGDICLDADIDRRLAAMQPRLPRASSPRLAWFLFGAAAMALCVALAAFAVDAVQTGAATAVQAERVAKW